MLSIKVIAIILCAFIAGCSAEPERLPNGKSYVNGSQRTYSIHYVSERDGKLVYAFLCDPELRITSTNDASTTVSSEGVHWLKNSRDGLWVNKIKQSPPAGTRVFAIRKDGSIQALAWDLAKYPIGQDSGFTDPIFVEDVIAPAMGILSKSENTD